MSTSNNKALHILECNLVDCPLVLELGLGKEPCQDRKIADSQKCLSKNSIVKKVFRVSECLVK